MPDRIWPEIDPVTKRFVDAGVDANYYGSSTGDGAGTGGLSVIDNGDGTLTLIDTGQIVDNGDGTLTLTI